MTDVNERLRAAAIAGAEIELKALLQEPGCNALSKDECGRPALMCAARYGNETCVGLLLPVSDALAKDEDDLTALMCAAFNGHESCIRLLLPASDALAQNDSGLTALMCAACYGHEGCIRLLLPASDALVKDEHGRTARELAWGNGHERVAQFIDAYALAQSELAAIGDAAGPGDPRRRAGVRV